MSIPWTFRGLLNLLDPFVDQPEWTLCDVCGAFMDLNGFDSNGWHECPLEEDLDCEPYDNDVEMRLEDQ